MLPVTLYFFYQTSLYSMLLNILVVPLLPVLMQAGLVGAVLGLCSQRAGMFFAAPAGYLLSFLEQLAQGILHLPEAVWVGGRPSLLALFVYYAALALFCALAVQRQKKLRHQIFKKAARPAYHAAPSPIAHLRAAELPPVAVLDLPGGDGEIRRQALFAL